MDVNSSAAAAAVAVDDDDDDDDARMEKGELPPSPNRQPYWMLLDGT